jgi:hypothetical protein
LDEKEPTLKEFAKIVRDLEQRIGTSRGASSRRAV